MLTVVIESPYAADTAAGVARNLRYLRACMAYCLAQDAAPYASHGLYTQPGVLNDKNPTERKNGMRAGFSIAKKLEERWLFIDLGITDGMLTGEQAADKIGQPTRRISIPDWEKVASDRDTADDSPLPGLCAEELRRALDGVPSTMPVVVRLSDTFEASDCGGITSAAIEESCDGAESFMIDASNDPEDFEAE